MGTFEIRDKNINSEEIKKKIEERVKQKRLNGVYDRMLDEYFRNKTESYNSNILYGSLYGAKEIAQVNIDYKIESHRAWAGLFIIPIKKIIRAIVALPLRALFQRQEEFNFFVVNFLQSITERTERIELEKQLRVPFKKIDD